MFRNKKDWPPTGQTNARARAEPLPGDKNGRTTIG